jgi:hypothetical protein
MCGSERSVATDSAATNAAVMIQMGCASRDPLRRAQIFAEAQPQLAWALRSAVEECQEDHRSWADIGRVIGLPRETVYRQFNAGGPIVTTKAVQSASSPNLTTKNAYAADAIFAFQTEDGVWHPSLDDAPADEFTTAMLRFEPAEPEINQFAGQVLRVRFGPCQKDVSFASAQVRLADGSERRVRVTYDVVNLLFEDGQTPLRRALTAVVHATLGNSAVDPVFQDIVRRAADAQVSSVSSAGENRIPTTDFIAAVQAIVDKARTADPLDVHSAVAVRRLEKVVADYQAWGNALR